MRKNILIFLFLAAITVISVSAESWFSGEGTFDYAAVIYPNGETEIDLSLSLSPIIAAQSEWFDLRYVGAVTAAEGGVDLSDFLRTFELRIFAGDYLTFTFGRFSYAPGTGEFISNVNFFEGTDYTSLLSAGVSSYPPSTDLIQISAFLGSFYLNGLVAPLYLPLDIPDPESMWFPNFDFPQEIPWPFPPFVKTYRSMLLEDEENPGLDIDSMSFGLEAGASFPWFDVSLLLFHGWDRSPLTSARIVFALDDTGVYDVSIAPYPRRITALGFTGVFGISSFRGWVDGAYTFEKSFLTRKLSSENLTTEIATNPSLELTGGISYELPVASLTLLAEYSTLFMLGDQSEDIIMPFLHTTITGFLGVGLFDYRLKPQLVIRASTVDWSTALLAKLALAMSDELELVLQTPFFFGGGHTELGYFGDRQLLSFTVQTRF